MAQTTSDNPTEGIPRPLPRGGRPMRSRDTRPRFQSLDAVWIVLLAALYATVNYPEWGLRHIGLYCMFAGVGTVALTYLLGWRASGRSAGVIAGLLLATSTAFGTLSLDTLGVTLFALVTVAALFAFVAGSSLAALALAVVAVWLRPDSILLGVMLMTLSLIQRRQRAAWGAALFLVPAIAIWAYLLTNGLASVSTPLFDVHLDTLAWIAAPGTVFLSWFLLPFLGELGDAVRRARWLPVIWWAGLYLLLETFLRYNHNDGSAAVLVPFIPLWFVVVGAGIARLLPAMTGDIPVPYLRYVVATVAVVALVGIRGQAEWQRPTIRTQPPALSPAPAATPLPVSVPVRKRKPAKKPTPLAELLPKNPLPVKPKPVGKIAPTKPTVPLYTIKNGRMVKRSKWAIQWDMTHLKP